MNYFELQKAVFDYLWRKHQADNSFRFTVRQVASKGAEKNYFIGTPKSGYFAFTCWDIPVSYPGSSADLTNFVFFKGEKTFGVKFQYLTTKAATDRQLQGDLQLGQLLAAKLEAAGVEVVMNPPENKMFYFQVFPKKRMVESFDELMQCFEELYAAIQPTIAACIEEIKTKVPGWQVRQIDQPRFDELIRKMHERIKKYSAATPQEIATLPEETESIGSAALTDNGGSFALNTILYGPPGTGKTYTTIARSIQIVNPDFDFTAKSRKEVKQEYERLQKEGLIEFVTFHQSMTYEDFIEGIKPVEPKPADTYLKYEIKPGILKRLVAKARFQPSAQSTGFSLSEEDFSKATFYKVSLGNTANPDDDQIYEYCMANGYIALGWGGANDFSGKTEEEIQQMVPSQLSKFEAQAVNIFIHYLKKDDYVVVSYGNLQFRAIGKVIGDYEYRKVEGLGVNQFRRVQWLLRDEQIPVSELYYKNFSQQTIYKLNKAEIKKEFFVKASKGAVQPAASKRNYVLIIDEINRGNISQIFGELITLIEDDKRKGREEELEVTLPYSGERFCIPDNLYIIGTMNTADRSVEALDTALRRRFSFEEMQANAEHPDLPTAVTIAGTSYNFREVLLIINKRLEKLIGRDHQIGHSYFLPKAGWTWANYLAAFTNKIIPLLQEYFYGDYAKMCLVVGKGFVDIEASSSDETDLSFFAAADHEALDSLLEKPVWRLQPVSSEESFANALNLLLNK